MANVARSMLAMRQLSVVRLLLPGLPANNNTVVQLYAAGTSNTANYVIMTTGDLGTTTNDNNIYFTITYSTAQ